MLKIFRTIFETHVKDYAQNNEHGDVECTTETGKENIRPDFCLTYFLKS